MGARVERKNTGKRDRQWNDRDMRKKCLGGGGPLRHRRRESAELGVMRV
jgi:hypothetical protein